VKQILHRDGTVDLLIEFDAGSALIGDIIERRLVIHPSMRDSIVREVVNSSVMYTLEGVELSDGNMFQVDNQSQSVRFMDKDKFVVKREFKFPYWYYSVEVDMTHDFSENGTNALSGLLAGGLFNIAYTLEVFGNVVDTDGEPIDDRNVRFNIGSRTNKILHVTFREFFWTEWFS